MAIPASLLLPLMSRSVVSRRCQINDCRRRRIHTRLIRVQLTDLFGGRLHFGDHPKIDKKKDKFFFSLLVHRPAQKEILLEFFAREVGFTFLFFNQGVETDKG